MNPEIYDVMVGSLRYGTVAMERDGWRFYPHTSAHKPSRTGHPTSRHAIPSWIPRGYKLEPVNSART